MGGRRLPASSVVLQQSRRPQVQQMPASRCLPAYLDAPLARFNRNHLAQRDLKGEQLALLQRPAAVVQQPGAAVAAIACCCCGRVAAFASAIAGAAARVGAVGQLVQQSQRLAHSRAGRPLLRALSGSQCEDGGGCRVVFGVARRREEQGVGGQHQQEGALGSGGPAARVPVQELLQGDSGQVCYT